MKGIYKISSPSNSVYIGQSINIKRRFAQHKCESYHKKLIKLNRSFNKYGVNYHDFEILYVFPEDVGNEVLTIYEQFYIDQFKEAGFVMLNSKEAGSRGAHDLATRKKISERLKGIKRTDAQKLAHSLKMTGRASPRKDQILTEESKEKIRIARSKQTNIKGLPKGNIPWNKGIKTGVSWNKGRTLSEETKGKISNKLKGRKLSPESIDKRTATLKKNGVKRKWSEESKRRQSERYKGKPSARKGAKLTKEQRLAISVRQKGISKGPLSTETKIKISEARKKYFERIKSVL